MITERHASRFLVVAVCKFLILSTIAFAHGDQQHVMGTVTTVDPGSISVKTSTGEVKAVVILARTKFVKGTSAAAPQDLKVGDRVVIHAILEGNRLQATEVKIGEIKNTTLND